MNEEGLAYLWLKITSIFAKQNHSHEGTYSTTGHNHDGRYALADHSHEGATSFGTLEIASNTINLCPYVGPTYTVYDVRECPLYDEYAWDCNIFRWDLIHYQGRVNDYVAEQILKEYKLR